MTDWRETPCLVCKLPLGADGALITPGHGVCKGHIDAVIKVLELSR